MWPDRRILDLLGIDVPILEAPMAGAVGTAMAIAVAEAGGLGALPCALIGPEQIRAELGAIRASTSRPINLNFFCHRLPEPDAERERQWRQRLAPWYAELGIDPATEVPRQSRVPFDDKLCALVEELLPDVVSFHFGLPRPDLVARVRATGAKVLSTATTVEEARWLEDGGCDAIIAQGAEAGGHRGMFLTDSVATQIGTMALVPQVVDAVRVPVIAAGGIGDARGIAAAFALGAAAVQLGTAYLFCPEAKISPAHREALRASASDATAITNLVTGRPARGIMNRLMREAGPMSEVAPAFPLAGTALAPLRNARPTDFGSLWSGQAARLGREMPAAELTRRLADEALRLVAIKR